VSEDSIDLLSRRGLTQFTVFKGIYQFENDGEERFICNFALHHSPIGICPALSGAAKTVLFLAGTHPLR